MRKSAEEKALEAKAIETYSIFFSLNDIHWHGP